MLQTTYHDADISQNWFAVEIQVEYSVIPAFFLFLLFSCYRCQHFYSSTLTTTTKRVIIVSSTRMQIQHCSQLTEPATVKLNGLLAYCWKFPIFLSTLSFNSIFPHAFFNTLLFKHSAHLFCGLPASVTDSNWTFPRFIYARGGKSSLLLSI